MVKICEVVDGCEDCPKYGDDCDGDKMAEHTDHISRADAICEVLVNDGIDNIVDRINALPSDEPNCGICKHYEPKYDVCHAPELVKQVTSKLKNPCDSLLTDDSDECKEQKSKLESAEAVSIHEDGTLEVKVPNAHKVGRVLVVDTDSHIGGGLFYPDDAVQGKWMPIEEKLPTYDGGEKIWLTGMKCSYCGKLFDLRVGYYFCPNCGARMYKGGKDE